MPKQPDALMASPLKSIKPECFYVTRYAPSQNQEGSGCSGEAEGVRWDPSTLRQGDKSLPVRFLILTLTGFIVLEEFVFYLELI